MWNCCLLGVNFLCHHTLCQFMQSCIRKLYVYPNISTQFLLQSLCVCVGGGGGACVCACMCVFVVLFFFFFIILYVNCFSRTMLYMCTDIIFRLICIMWLCVEGDDERMISVHYYDDYYLAVTCHLHFWQNDRDLLVLHATVVTRGWNE